MKPLTGTLLTEQMEPSTRPYIKVQAQAYGHPAKATKTRVNKYDFKDTGFGGCEMACVCSDGSLLMKDGSTIKRYATPLTSSTYASINVPTAVDDPGDLTLVLGAITDMIADPNSAEVMLFAVGTWAYPGGSGYPACNPGAVFYSKSSNYGQTWGNWQCIDVAPPAWEICASTETYGMGVFDVKGAYDDSSNIGLAVRISYMFDSPTYADQIAFMRRYNDTWVSFKFRNFAVPASGIGNTFSMGGGMCHYNTSAEARWYNPVMAAYDIAWDEDWFIPVLFQQSNIYGALPYQIDLNYMVAGDGTNYTRDKIYVAPCGDTATQAGIMIADADIKINSFSDFSPLGLPSGELKSEFGAYLLLNPVSNQPGISWPETSDLRKSILSSGGAVYTQNNRLMGRPITGFKETYSEIYTERLSGTGELLLSVYADDKTIFLYNRPDYNVVTPVFAKGIAYECDRPLKIASNDSYVIAYNSQKMLISSYGDWAKPTAGTGAGATYDIPQSKIIYFRERSRIGETSTLEIMVDNKDGTFDSPGTGAITALKRGSRINLYLGYTIGGVNYSSEYARYFIDYIGYLRQPNRSVFAIKCIDGHGLAQKYKFPCPVYFNEYDSDDKYNYIKNGKFSELDEGDYVVVSDNSLASMSELTKQRKKWLDSIGMYTDVPYGVYAFTGDAADGGTSL